MRESVPLSVFVCAGLVAGALAAQPPTPKKPKTSPAVVLITVDDQNKCHVEPKSVTIVSRNAPAGTKGPKKVRFFFARGDGDKSKVKLRAKPGQTHPDIVGLPKFGTGVDRGDSKESTKKLPTGSPDYKFEYLVELDVEGDITTCDPDIIIQKPGG